MRYLVDGWNVYLVLFLEIVFIVSLKDVLCATSRGDIVGGTVAMTVFGIAFLRQLFNTIRYTYKGKKTNTIEEVNKKWKH